MEHFMPTKRKGGIWIHDLHIKQMPSKQVVIKLCNEEDVAKIS